MFKLPIEAIRRGLGLASRDQAQEVANELAPELAQVSEQGVVVTPETAKRGQQITITYSGLLHRSGATSMYLHHGSGPGAWSKVADTAMQQSEDGWMANLTADDASELAFCFHDGANHWDNNYEQDWHVAIK